MTNCTRVNTLDLVQRDELEASDAFFGGLFVAP